MGELGRCASGHCTHSSLVHGAAEGIFTVCSALCIRKEGSGEPALKCSQFSLE